MASCNSEKWQRKLQETRDKMWIEHYNKAKEYKMENGDLLIPSTYLDDTGFKLGKWLGTQRYKYKQGVLDFEREDMLNDLGIVWNVNHAAFEAYYKEAVAYYQVYGDLDAEYDDLSPGGLNLGEWLQVQRKRKKSGKMLDWQMEKLDAIGMIWDKPEAQWTDYYAEAVAYYEANGNLNVKPAYKTASGKNLGYWLGHQRNYYNRGVLKQDRFEKLSVIGMVWTKFEYRWEDYYAIAETYYKKHGNLSVIRLYRTESGVYLGDWLYRQRRKYRLGQLEQEKIDRLNQIGMIWDVR